MLLLMIALELALVFPLSVALFALVRWRGGWRTAAVLPAAGFLGALLLFDLASRGHDLTEAGMLTVMGICGTAIAYYALLLIRRQRVRPHSGG